MKMYLLKTIVCHIFICISCRNYEIINLNGFIVNWFNFSQWTIKAVRYLKLHGVIDGSRINPTTFCIDPQLRLCTI